MTYQSGTIFLQVMVHQITSINIYFPSFHGITYDHMCI